jgi:RNA polymerase sigma factor (sigma-70 family)
MEAEPDSNALCAAAVDLVTSSSASFKRTARRYSLCAHDAEDAYQRSLEILLTKAPTDRRDELRPWLHTVIKHEALALRRQRERSVSGEDEAAGAAVLPATDRGPEEAATGRERVQRTAEALSALKPGEIQCLILKALGYSYEEISARTGFSWTKVNRSLTEGRRRFFARFGEIASGTACDRYQPLLSAVCDGHAAAPDERLVRAHLAGCPGCRAALREYRAAPTRLAELLPPAMVLPLLERTGMWTRIHDWFAVTAGERATAVGLKLQQSAEIVSAQKAAAVVASTAAIAGGGVAVKQQERDRAGHPARAEQAATVAPEPAPAEQAPVPAPDQAPAPPPEPPAQNTAAPETREFEFEARTAPVSSSAAPAQEFSAGGGGGPSPKAKPKAAASGGGEFGP